MVVCSFGKKGTGKFVDLKGKELRFWCVAGSTTGLGQACTIADAVVPCASYRHNFCLNALTKCRPVSRPYCTVQINMLETGQGLKAHRDEELGRLVGVSIWTARWRHVVSG